MKFIDSSVFVAAALESSARFEASNLFLENARSGVTSGHALIETYSTLTRLPAGFRLSPGQASAFIANWMRDINVFSLAANDVLTFIAEAPARGVMGGRIYDALHARTAKKAGATAIVTWNAKHFAGLEAGLKIETP